MEVMGKQSWASPLKEVFINTALPMSLGKKEEGWTKGREGDGEVREEEEEEIEISETLSHNYFSRDLINSHSIILGIF